MPDDARFQSTTDVANDVANIHALDVASTSPATSCNHHSFSIGLSMIASCVHLRSYHNMICSVIMGRSVRRTWNKQFISLSQVMLSNVTVKVWSLEAAILSSGCLVPTRLRSDQLQDQRPLRCKMNPLSLLRQCGEIRMEQSIFSDFSHWKATCAGVFQSSLCQPSLRNGWSLRCRIQEYGTVASSINDDPLTPSSICFRLYMDYLCREYQHIPQLLQGGEPLSESKQRELRCRLTELSSIIDKQEELKDAQHDLAELNQMIEGSRPGNCSDKDMQELALAEKDEFVNKIQDLEEELVDLMLPSEDSEDIDILVEFTAGVGGQEAMLFTGDIFEMYKRYANYKQWKFDVFEYFNSDLGGVRHASVSISGKQAFRLMKQEAGVHRVQRVPKTEKQSRIHTSTMTVAVLPQPKEIDLKLDPKDLRVETKKASGAGGQHVNTTDSAVRITHLPSGITAESQQERSQHKNRIIAMTILETRIFNRIQAAQTSSEQILRRSQVGTSARSEKIKTYNFQQDRITDHRISQSVHNVEEYLCGSELLDEMIWSVVEEEERKELRRRILEVYEKHCNTLTE